MINISYNVDVRDAPFNQNKVQAGFNNIHNIVSEINEDVALSFQNRFNMFAPTNLLVIVYHTCDLTEQTKTQLIDAITNTLTIKKTSDIDCEIIKTIIFEKIAENNYFVL